MDNMHFFGLPSPSSSLNYMYNDAELYLDSSTTSSTTSPMESPYDMPGDLGIYASPEHDGSVDLSQSDLTCISQQDPAAAKQPKRKRENRYKNAPPSVLSNRASQRAYRERKDQRIKDLEVLLTEAQSRNDVLSQAYTALQSEYVKLRSEQDSTAHYEPETAVHQSEHGSSTHYPQQRQSQPQITYHHGIGTATAASRPDLDFYLYPDTAGYIL